MLKKSIFIMLLTAFIGYSGIVYFLGTETAKPIEFSQEIQKGKRLWNAHNCVACHQLYGLGGFMGPDLTNTISAKGEAYARAFILGGTLRMPNFHFSETEVQALIAFLSSVDSTGTSPPTTFKATWFGTIPSYTKEKNSDPSE